jgi:hypothetical protein
MGGDTPGTKRSVHYSSPMATNPSANRFTIEVWWHGMNGSTESNVFGSFGDDEWGDLLREMGISGERYQNFLHQAASQAIAGLEVSPLIHEFPQLSRLAACDEGNVRFIGKDLTQLMDDAGNIKQTLRSAAAITIQMLLDAGDHAMSIRGELVIHPFGTH